jgi:hypothetical protein
MVAALSLLYFISGFLTIGSSGTGTAPFAISKDSEHSQIPPARAETSCSAWIKHVIPPADDQFSPDQQRYARSCEVRKSSVFVTGNPGERIDFEVRIIQCPPACVQQRKDWGDDD